MVMVWYFKKRNVGLMVMVKRPHGETHEENMKQIVNII